MTTVGGPRRVGAVLLALPFVLLAVLGLASAPASAHAVLEATTPGQGSQVSAPPTEVRLVFSEEVGIADRAVQVLDPRGRRVDGGDPQHVGGDARTLRVSLPGGLATGSYTVTWRVVSADGHPASGTFAFGVGVPAGAPPPDVTVDPTVAAIRAVAQLTAYAGAALVIGGSFFLFVLWPAGQGDPGLRRLLAVSCGVAGLGAVGTLLIQGPYVSGSGLGGVADPGLLVETISSSYGRPLLLRVLAVALSVPVLGLWPRVADDEDGGPGGIAAAGNMLLLAASFALTGHAAEASPRLLAEAADAVHLVAAGIWLGGLVVLFAAFLPAASPALQASVLPRWSRLAMTCVGAILVTGTYQAWREVRVLGALPGTAYGRLLLAKLALVLVVLAVAAVARRRLATPGRLRSLVTAEAVLGLAVLGVTSFLVATPPSRVTFGPPYAATVTAQDVEGRTLRVAVYVTPTRAGGQTVRLQVAAPDGTPVSFTSATGQLRGPDDAPPVDVRFVPTTAVGEAGAQVAVPSPGRWTLTVHVLTNAVTDYAATTTYTVR